RRGAGGGRAGTRPAARRGESRCGDGAGHGQACARRRVGAAAAPERRELDDGRVGDDRCRGRFRGSCPALAGFLPRTLRPGTRALARCLAADPPDVTKPLLWAVAAALVVPALAVAFGNTEPLAGDQWYLNQDRAWSYWPAQPSLAPVKVAVVDSGIDYGHPEFAGRILAGRSFVGGSWKHDSDG